MTAAEREAMIEQRWEDVSGWEGLLVDATLEARLSQAFYQVLMAMPVDVCRQFLELNPLVLCQQGASAAVLGLMVHPVGNMEEAGRWQPVMYFAPTIARMADHHLVDCVAHEMAHVLLGHYRPEIGLQRSTREAEADHLSTQWGFRRRYRQRQLDHLRALEES